MPCGGGCSSFATFQLEVSWLHFPGLWHCSGGCGYVVSAYASWWDTVAPKLSRVLRSSLCSEAGLVSGAGMCLCFGKWPVDSGMVLAMVICGFSEAVLSDLSQSSFLFRPHLSSLSARSSMFSSCGFSAWWIHCHWISTLDNLN